MEPNPMCNTAAEEEPAALTLHKHKEHTPQRMHKIRQKEIGIQMRGARSHPAVGQAVAIDSTLLQYFLGTTAKERNKGTR